MYNKIRVSLILLVLMTTCASVSATAHSFDIDKFLNKTTVYVGASYKFQEQYDSINTHKPSPIGARFGITYNYSDTVSFGIDHHSQWLSGFPFGGKDIYSKTEVFIDIKFTLSNLLN